MDLAASQLLFPSKEIAAKEFQEWLSRTSIEDAIIFTDGSQAENKAVGWGFAFFIGNTLHSVGHGRLGPAEVFDAEICGALGSSDN